MCSSTASPAEAPVTLPRLVSECGDSGFGEGCERNCSCHHGVCDQRSGKCVCHAGWTGDRCDLGKRRSFGRFFILALSSAVSLFRSMKSVSALYLSFPEFCRPVRSNAGVSTHHVSQEPPRQVPAQPQIHAFVQIISPPPTSVPYLLRK